MTGANPRTVAVLEGGSAFIIERWRREVPAILMLWYPGMEGGTALARLLFGDVAPSGKLPFTIPHRADELPFFDTDTDRIDYGLYHGYTLLDREGSEPAYAFGFGLSYTTFETSDPRVVVESDRAAVTVKVRNTGRRAGAEVVQLYVGFAESSVDRPARLLRAFTRLELSPGEERDVTLEVRAGDLSWYDEAAGSFALEDIEYTALVGGSSRAQDLVGARFRFDSFSRS